ncbi:hypothetical protein [uncultured Thiodictyon sp.]|uniref:hypothetical protein n=1 Tax=uncultured Thiodictyon sp. TaxID=1846217 RepID=UPI0025EFD858|nr:hypothetical protein [uncultured Thiodictyon sp.]
MSKSDYVPPSDADFLRLLDKFLARAKEAGDCLLPEDLAQLQTGAAELHAGVAEADQSATAHKNAVARKKDIRDRVERNFRAVGRRIKAHAKYTPALGALMGLEGADYTPKPATAKPSLSGLDLSDGEIQIDFTKGPMSDAIHLYCQREGDTGWVLLGLANVSPFIDRRPLLVPGKPELRRYTAVYVKNYKEFGQFSDEIVVNCAP